MEKLLSLPPPHLNNKINYYINYKDCTLFNTKRHYYKFTAAREFGISGLSARDRG